MGLNNMWLSVLGGGDNPRIVIGSDVSKGNIHVSKHGIKIDGENVKTIKQLQLFLLKMAKEGE